MNVVKDSLISVCACDKYVFSCSIVFATAANRFANSTQYNIVESSSIYVLLRILMLSSPPRKVIGQKTLEKLWKDLNGFNRCENILLTIEKKVQSE